MTYILLMVAMVLCGCERREMYDVSDTVEVNLELEIDVEVSNEGTVGLPATFAAIFSHKQTGEFLYRDYTPAEGGVVHVGGGKYNLLVYNFDTYSTHVREDHHLHTIEAYTNEVLPFERGGFDEMQRAVSRDETLSRDYLGQRVVYEPDHLFVAQNDQVDIPYNATENLHIVLYAEAKSIVKVYTIDIRNLTGVENIREARIYLTGQVSSVQFGTGKITGDPVTLYFPVYKYGENGMKNIFHTFGRYPGVENKVYMVVDIIDNGGNERIWEWDVTDQFDDDDNREIIIEDNIDVPPYQPSQSGGFVPTVSTWLNHESNIIM